MDVTTYSFGARGWNSLDSYDNDLKCNTLGLSRNKEYDIMKVYKPTKEAQIGHKEDCDLIWERGEEFTKEDLKVGMSVITREGKGYDVCMKVDAKKTTRILFCNDGTWRPLSYYEDNLMWCNSSPANADIMKVYSDRQLVYERNE